MTAPNWKIITADDGAVVMTAEAVASWAEIFRETPREFAQKEARLLSSNAEEVIAVRAQVTE